MLRNFIRNLSANLPKYEAEPQPSAMRDLLDNEPAKYDPEAEAFHMQRFFPEYMIYEDY